MYALSKDIDFNEFPTILWDKKYDTDPECLEMMCQHISDFMLLRTSSTSKEEKERKMLYNIFEGKVEDHDIKKLYDEVLNTFGAQGSSKLKDYNFFYSYYQSIQGMLLRIPFKMGAHNISQSVVDERIDSLARMAAAMQRNKVAKQLSQEDGQDFSFMENKEEYVPKTIEELLSLMNAPQQEEYALTRLLQNLEHRHHIGDEFVATNKDHFVAGYQFCQISDEDGEPVIKYLDRKNLSYISPVPVRDMDDPNITAWSIKGWISMENALRKYGQDLASAKSSNYLKDTITKLRGDGRYKFKYDPRKYQVNGATMNFDNTDPVIIDGMYQQDWDGQDYQPFFYNVNDNGLYGRGMSMLEQKVYFKVIKAMRFKLTIGGKNPTREQYNMWKRERRKIEDKKIRYIPVDDDYKAKRGETVVTAPKEELWEFDRLGHCTIINIRKYRYQTRYEREMNRVRPPIVGIMSREKSFVEIGKEFSIFYNAFMLKAAELRNIAGADDILLIDEAQMDLSQRAKMFYEAQHTASVTFNSTLIQNKENPTAQKHLTTVSLTPKVATIIEYFKAADILKNTFGAMIGKLGEPSPYDSAEKVNQMLQQTSLLTQNYFREDHLFRLKALQRWADIVKMHYGSDSDRYVSVFWKNSEKEILKVTKELSMYDYEIYMKTGIEVIEDRNFIMSQAEKAMSAGSLGFMDFVKIYYSDNIQEAVATIQRAMNALKEDAAAQQQQANEIAQQQLQVQADKNRIPIEVKEIDSADTRYVADMRYRQQSESLQSKEDANDISAANKREEALLDAQLSDAQMQAQREAEVENIVLEKNMKDVNKEKVAPKK